MDEEAWRLDECEKLSWAERQVLRGGCHPTVYARLLRARTTSAAAKTTAAQAPPVRADAPGRQHHLPSLSPSQSSSATLINGASL